jgi:transcriptional regulator with XRE-family HTH domain
MAKKTKENNIFPNMETSELNSDELPGYADEVGSFPERLREIIGGQSVRSFAAECHLSDGVVRQYLAGKSEPGLESLLAIAATANVSVDWLAAGFGNKDDDRFGDQIALARKKRGANRLCRKAEEEAVKASDEGEMRRADKPSEEDKRLREQYPLSPLTAKAFGISDSQSVVYVGQKDHPYAWFHQWIDEELKGKSITEVMSLAVKIKTGLDKEREE